MNECMGLHEQWPEGFGSQQRWDYTGLLDAWLITWVLVQTLVSMAVEPILSTAAPSLQPSNLNANKQISV